MNTHTFKIPAYYKQRQAVAANTLRDSWGTEWLNLSGRQMFAVADDFEQARISAPEYKRRIFTGNLESYAKTLLA